MKKLVIYGMLALLLTSGVERVSNDHKLLPNQCFSPGEMMTFRAHYGFINAAEGVMIVRDDIYHFNNRPSYKIDVFGYSTGFFDFITRIRDHWGSYVDTTQMIPHYFFRNLKEGRYRKYESTNFDHEKDSATVLTFDKETFKIKTHEKFGIPNNAQDLVSGYYYLRLFRFFKLPSGRYYCCRTHFSMTNHTILRFE